MKSKFSNCINCPQYNQDIVIGETNCDDNLSKVRILILAEAPAYNEVVQKRPLVGKAGAIFREAFHYSKLDTIPHFISNVVLCANLDKKNKTNNPPEEAIECCKDNWKKLIEVTNPELIFIMGTIPMKSFGIADSGVTKLRGKFYDFNGKKVLLTTHPSYILQNGGLKSEPGTLFLDDFNLAYTTLNTKQISIPSKKLTEPYYFKLPEKCYGDNVSLFDIQLDKSNMYKPKIVYIFNSIDGRRLYHTEPSSKNYFYTKSGCNGDTPNIVSVDEVDLVVCEKHPGTNVASFESDVKKVQKHMVDYRYVRKKFYSEEPKINPKILYMDIEVFSEGSRVFPRPELAEKPINSISFINGNEKVNVFLLRLPEMDKTPINNFSDINIRLFDSEIDLIDEFCNNIRQNPPDIISAWNGSGARNRGTGFDYPYLFQRMKNLGMNINKISPRNYATIENVNGFIECFSLGVVLLDQLLLYKKFNQNLKPSYKLGFICQEVLGKDKVSYEGTLDDNYMKNINKFIEYSAIDTCLLKELEEKLKHINLLNEMILTCSTTWDSYLGTVGFVDPLFISYAKENNLVCRDSLSNKKENFSGAFVKVPKPGIHKWVIDLDYSSLYPSIIVSYNLDITTYIAKIDPNLAKHYIYNKEKMPNNFLVKLDPWKTESYKNVKMDLSEFDNFIKKNKAIVTINGCVYLGHDIKKSFVSDIINYLWESRRKYQSIMKKYPQTSDEYIVSNIRQDAYKRLMNSVYGALGNTYFRLFNIDIASSITWTGVEISKFAQFHSGWWLNNGSDKIDLEFNDKYENSNIPYIIYGDTDSLFISLGEYIEDKLESSNMKNQA